MPLACKFCAVHEWQIKCRSRGKEYIIHSHPQSIIISTITRCLCRKFAQVSFGKAIAYNITRCIEQKQEQNLSSSFGRKRILCRLVTRTPSVIEAGMDDYRPHTMLPPAAACTASSSVARRLFSRPRQSATAFVSAVSASGVYSGCVAAQRIRSASLSM